MECEFGKAEGVSRMKTTINGFNVMQDFNKLIKEVRKLGCGGYCIPGQESYEYIFVTNNISAPIWHVLPTVSATDMWSAESETDLYMVERLGTLEESRAYRRMPNLLVVKFKDAYRAYDWLTLSCEEFRVSSSKGIRWSDDLVLRESERRSEEDDEEGDDE